MVMRPETLHRNAAYRDPDHPQGDEACGVCIATASAMPPAPQMRTEWHDGLEFEVGTWDPTPTLWNESGSWVADPEVETRVKAGIMAAIPNCTELLEEAESAARVPVSEWCGTFWGSHGCGREKGHPGLCVCDPDPRGEDGPCSAALKWGDNRTLILWHAGDESFWLSGLHWTWFE